MRWQLFLASAIACVAIGAATHASAPAPDAGVAKAAVAKKVVIPEASARYRLRVERAAAEYFGLDASAARIAAQLHAESAWKPDAQSPYANGLAQFTPSTAKWLPEICPELGAFDPWNESQAIDGAACYDAWLYARALPALSQCDRWAFTLSAYNGGERALRQERALAKAQGDDASVWFGSVETQRKRRADAYRENRDYVERILLRFEPAYIKAGWPGTAVCP